MLRKLLTTIRPISHYDTCRNVAALTIATEGLFINWLAWLKWALVCALPVLIILAIVAAIPLGMALPSQQSRRREHTVIMICIAIAIHALLIFYLLTHGFYP